jgi:glycosyltransferase involved in cell wall biosynthesis
MRAHHGFKEGQPLIGIVARLDPVKNHASLLRAMRHVIDTYSDATLLVIGDGPLRKKLEELATDLGLGRGIRFLGMRDDVPALLGALDVLVLCSLSEGLSVSLIEECAAGKPTVATAVGGNAEVVEHGRTGLLVFPGDAGALADAIIALLDDPQRASRLGQAARRKFLAEFTLERMVSHYVDIYEKCSAPSLP